MADFSHAQPLDTGYSIDDSGHIHDPDGRTGYRLECQRVYGPSGHTGYRLYDRDIFGPDGFTGFSIDGNRIVGPSATLPWTD